jgi:hypothetical protein
MRIQVTKMMRIRIRMRMKLFIGVQGNIYDCHSYWARSAERPTTPCQQHLTGSRTPAVQLRPGTGSRLTAAPGTRAGSRTIEAARDGSGTSRPAVGINGQTRGEVRKSRRFLPGILQAESGTPKSSSCSISRRIWFLLFSSTEGVCTDDLLSRKPGFLLSAMHSHEFCWFSFCRLLGFLVPWFFFPCS